MSADGLAVALLAAGCSTRFGAADKLTATLGDRPLLAWAAQAGLAIPARWRFLVAGPDLQTTMPDYAPLTNPHPEQGLASSLRIAAQAAEESGARALLVLLADVPFIDPAHLRRLIETHRRDDARPVFSTAPGGMPQPPALFPRRLLPALRMLEGDKGARGLAAEALRVETTAASLLDIDTPADLERARALLEQQ